MSSELHRLRTLHLFAGAGGGILADILLGHQPVCAVEIEPYCQQVLSARQQDGCIPWFPIFDDVQTFDGKPWRGKVDVVCGGFPCQDISVAGKGAGIGGEKSSMWKHMARIIGEVRPSYAFVENSPMLIRRGLGVVLADLAEMGYDAKWGIMGAHHVSAPHKRDRIWILAADSNLRGCDDGNSSERQDKANYSEVWNNQEDNQQGGNIGELGISENNSNVPNSISERGCCGNSEWQDAKDVRELTTNSRDNTRRVEWWDSEPNVGRVAHGVASRVDRLKAIGNGQVCSVAALAWNTLMA